MLPGGPFCKIEFDFITLLYDRTGAEEYQHDDSDNRNIDISSHTYI